MSTATLCRACDTIMDDVNGVTMCSHCDSPCRPEHAPHCRPNDVKHRCECCGKCVKSSRRNPPPPR